MRYETKATNVRPFSWHVLPRPSLPTTASWDQRELRNRAAYTPWPTKQRLLPKILAVDSLAAGVPVHYVNLGYEGSYIEPHLLNIVPLSTSGERDSESSELCF